MSAETELRPVEPGAIQVERLLADLNPPQREAVVHGEGPLLVLAGAGSGKTRVLTYRTDSLRMVKRCLEEAGRDPKRFPPRAIRARISGAKSQLIDPDAYASGPGSAFDEAIADVYRVYERRMREANAMDFDDLLVRTVNLLELFEDVRDRYRKAFRWVLVDEYQDTNRAQYRLLQLLCAEHGNLFVVGDDFQSIYRFSAQSRVLEDTLVRFEIPYQVIGGTKFYERTEIKDAVAYLSLLANPADAVSFARVVNSPRRGIGETTQARLLSHANTTGEDIWDVFSKPERVPALGPVALKAVGRFAETMARLRERVTDGEGSAPVAELLEAMLHESGYLEALQAERTIEAE